jgi:peptidoglycan lytic transglycosylase
MNFGSMKTIDMENTVFRKLTLSPLTALMLLGLLLYSCAPKTAPPLTAPGIPKPYKVMGKWYQPLADAQGFKQKGLASWYGKKFHGRKTSNGETYDMYGISAAHKTLPLGTIVEVTNLENGRELTVRINDRGPFVRGRIIDLSYGAAKKLGVVGPGTAKVKVVAVAVEHAEGAPATAVDLYSGNFTFQVGAFKNRDNAEGLVAKLGSRYENAHMAPFQDGQEMYYRVRVGQCTTLDEAEKFEARLLLNGFPGAFTVAE